MTPVKSLSTYRAAIAAIENLIRFDASAIRKHVVEEGMIGPLSEQIAALGRDHPQLGVKFVKSDHFAHDVGRGTYYKLSSIRTAIALILADLDAAIAAESAAARDRGAGRARATDPVTGLLTRSEFDTAFAAAVSESRTSGRPCGVIMVDLDRFKAVNDTHGHQKGDAVLRGVADVLTAAVSGKGLAFRYGGEENVIVLPNHDVEEATAVAERMRRAVETANIEGLGVTASLGVAVHPAHAAAAGELLKVADAAMYDAKRRGRNLVRVAGEPDPPSSAARAPVRREPTGDSLSDEDAATIRGDHFRMRNARCPRDGAILKVLESHATGEAVPRLLVNCPLCGLAGDV